MLFAVNTEAAIYNNGKWLVCVRSKQESEAPGALSFVGGTVEHSDARQDTLESAIVREVYEEIGVMVSVAGFINDSSFVSKKGNHVLNVVLFCEIVSGEPKAISPDEIESLYWMTSDEILNHELTTPWLCESIKRATVFTKRRLTNI